MKRDKNNNKNGNDQTVQPNENPAGESMEKIFDLKTPSTFAPEVKKSLLQDAWGKPKK